ncbi:hypothetical protein ACMXYX_15820 [Neptuniibacter sp. QD72_48]|uniref:hypothetical protein n=1 Tax=Neptuniibacter sp. QD72_48 TaxID=3398214 RepID=UPI0039F54EED
MTKENKIFAMLNSTGCFDLDEAISLLHQEIVRLEDRAYLPIPPNDKAGLIVGVIDLNDEVEVLVKFEEGVLQLTKNELRTGFLMAD